MILRLTPPIRRCYAALAALLVLFAPIAQVAHAQAMNHDAPECVHPASSHGHAPASSHTHQHDGACCDFCAAGCSTTAPLSTQTVAIAAAPVAEMAAVHFESRRLRPAARPHLLPFSLAPPSPSV